MALNSSKCAYAYDACLGIHTIVVSREILEEVKRVLSVKLQLPPEETQAVLDRIAKETNSSKPIELDAESCRDPADLHVLGLAVAAGADVIVTGDEDLLVLKSFRGIPILKPSTFLDQLA